MSGGTTKKPISSAEWGFLGVVLVAIVGAIGTIAVALINHPPNPQTTPTASTPVTAGAGSIAGSQVIPATTLSDFLVTIRGVPSDNPLFTQLGDRGKIPGASVLANIAVQNLQAKSCKVTGFVQKSPGGEIVSRSELPQGFDPEGITDYTFSPDGPVDSEQADFWLAYPIVPGTYMITTELICQKRLASGPTPPFQVELMAGETPTTQTGIGTATAVDTITPIVLVGTPTIVGTISPETTPSVGLTPVGTPIRLVPILIDPNAPQFKLPPEFYHPVPPNK